MAKVLNRPVKVSDKDHESVRLNPGDEVPSWAEKYVEDEWTTETAMAGTVNLYSDHVYQVVKGVADERGVEYGDDWSAEQIAAAVRLAEHNQSVVDSGVLGEDADPEDVASKSQEAMAALFATTNEAGNVNAPNRDDKPKSSKSSKSSSSSTSGGSGGAHS